MPTDCTAVGTDCRRPVHEHKPDPKYKLSPTQAKALRYVRLGDVTFYIAPCGPDDAVSASVDHNRPYWVRNQTLPHWDTYKALYRHGVIRLVQKDPRFPYEYTAEPIAAHPVNHLPVPAPTLATVS